LRMANAEVQGCRGAKERERGPVVQQILRTRTLESNITSENILRQKATILDTVIQRAHKDQNDKQFVNFVCLRSTIGYLLGFRERFNTYRLKSRIARTADTDSVPLRGSVWLRPKASSCFSAENRRWIRGGSAPCAKQFFSTHTFPWPFRNWCVPGHRSGLS
jgi:hypothetical protein